MLSSVVGGKKKMFYREKISQHIIAKIKSPSISSHSKAAFMMGTGTSSEIVFVADFKRLKG